MLDVQKYEENVKSFFSKKLRSRNVKIEKTKSLLNYSGNSNVYLLEKSLIRENEFSPTLVTIATAILQVLRNVINLH